MHPKNSPETDLVLDQLPNGETAWLRPAEQIDADARIPYVVTDAGRDVLRRAAAMRALFGQPWPTVAEAYAI